MFDAFIILSDTIQTPGVEKEVEKRIHRNFNGPVVCIDTDSEYFYSFWTDGYSAVYATISHLIEEHDLKDIAYLTGLKSHVHSQRRLDAFRDCMKAHGLEVRENRVFYGDFWYTSGTGCAEALARDRESLPEAVVCANDCMAIGLIDEFTSRGIRVPEDVAVFGYGTGEEGQKSPLLLSSTFIPAEYYGRYSVDCVMKLFNGDQPDEASPEARLFIGETCGCRSDEGMRVSKKRDTWMTEDSEEGFYSIHNTCMEDILLADSLHEMFNTLYENIHYLRGVKSFDVCLNEEWLSEEKLVKNIFPKSGYSNKSLNILSYSSVDPSICRVGDDKLFVTSELFPHSYDESIPSCYLFMPLFFEDNSFGYGIVSYGSETGRIEDVVRHWMKMISRGLEGYRRQHAISVLELKNSIKSEKKFPTYMYSDEQIRSRMEKLDEKEREELELVSRILDENKLTYHFQPIVSAVDGEIFSYEALMRSDTRIKIAPLEIIKMADLMDRLDDVERATLKNVLGIIEDDPDRFGDKKIFINASQFIDRKNNMQLLDIFKNRKEHLLLVGEGKELNVYLSFIKDNDMKNVTILPFKEKEELFEIFKGCNAFISLAKKDIYGHTILEALSCGLPVISSNKVNSALELIENGKNGYVVSLDNDKEIKEAIDKVTDIPFENTISTVKGYTVEASGKALAKIFEEIHG